MRMGAGTDATPHDYSFTDEAVVSGQTYSYYIEDVDFSGKTNQSHILKVTVGQQRLQIHLIPRHFALLQNFPNPFNPETWIPFQLASPQEVTVRIYDVRGTLVRQLALGKLPAEFYLERDKAAHWDGKNDAGSPAASGIYFYQLKAGDDSQVRRMVVVR